MSTIQKYFICIGLGVVAEIAALYSRLRKFHRCYFIPIFRYRRLADRSSVLVYWYDCFIISVANLWLDLWKWLGASTV